MYRGIAEAPNSGVWVAVDRNDSVTGFVSGTAHVGHCYKSVLLHHGAVMAMHALPTAVSAATWKHVFETLAYPKREISEAPPTGSRPEPSAELLSIVVSAQGRGTGAAGMLVSALETGLKSWGHNGAYRVVTVATDPRSNRFYEKVGFRRVRKFQHHGIDMNLYHKDIDD